MSARSNSNGAVRPCGGCRRPMRPPRATAARYPDTVRDYGSGRCATCARRRNAGQIDLPLLATDADMDLALSHLRYPPAACGWFPIICALCGWRKGVRSRPEQLREGYAHALTHLPTNF